MKQTPFDQNDASLDPYQNGQSDAEKLMRRHLQTPGDVITDDDLKSLRTTVTTPLENNQVPEEDASLKKEETDDEQKITPWDVIGE